ncbi:DNA polymerase subunit beta [Sulfuricella sp. T08]|uniref:type VII toxin-antitoxin system MntA family adenylyltransferase antitoxin n=1 Tax=Sulfuricella sp. T08 TaxID=1632857 RepID=UPI000617A044|nr:nucleotidyltransferase domain-containing protein [Sulfuricella sp. T08]GAO34810.1 DNA polymerase subunit beta [Sulfuricella sp. T08]
MNKLQSQIIEMLLNSLPGVLAVYRFGSWGTQQERRESDIDLAVLPLQPLPPLVRWETAQKLAKMLSRDVDLVDLRAASTVMRSQVVAQGERLYCRDEAVVGLFETTVFSEYARLNEERREILADIRARGSVYAG